MLFNLFYDVWPRLESRPDNPDWTLGMCEEKNKTDMDGHKTSLASN